jgi:hypothetical protein
VLVILRERGRHRHPERVLLDLDVDTELAQHLMESGVKIGDRDTVGQIK